MISRLDRWQDPLFKRRQIDVYVFRDDLADPWTGGNKRRKLKYQLTAERLQKIEGVYTFGGPFSNHLAAVAATCAQREIPSLGFVRGNEVSNPVLDKLQQWGMRLQFLSPTTFLEFQKSAPEELNHCLEIPMGGAHPLALKGCAEIVEEVRSQIPVPPTHFAVAAGTGSTAAGIASALAPDEKLCVFPAIKGPELNVWVEGIFSNFNLSWDASCYLDVQASGKGFARHDPVLWEWLKQVNKTTGILFDPIYTGKMAFRIFQLIEEGFFAPGSRIVLIHTGGKPGLMGYQWRYLQEEEWMDIPTDNRGSPKSKV